MSLVCLLCSMVQGFGTFVCFLLVFHDALNADGFGPLCIKAYAVRL